MAKIDELFKLMNTKGASDLHLITGSRPFLRIHGEIIEQVDHQLLENDELQSMLYEIAPENKIKVFEEIPSPQAQGGSSASEASSQAQAEGG